MKIDCILPQRSQYEVLHHFTEKVGEALRRRGHSVRLITMEESFDVLKENLPEATLAFNGAPQLEDGSFLCDKWGTPHYACLVDPPFYYLGLLESPWITVACDDKDSLSQLKELGDYEGKFFTQGVEPELISQNTRAKEFDLVFMGSYFDIEEARRQMREYYTEELYLMIENAITATFLDSSLSLYDAFTCQIAGKGHLVEGLDLVRLYYVMSYVQKGEARNMLLLSLKGLPVHIWDSRWKSFCENYLPNAILHDAVGYKESLEIFKRSKIVLCNSIRSVNGCNERVLNALACGAVPFTNSNPYFAEQFVSEKHLLTYEHAAMHKNEGIIREVLQNPVKLAEIQFEGQKLITEKHTWDSRLENLGL